MRRFPILLLALLMLAPHAAGKVIEENADTLPPGCDELRGDEMLTVHAGTKYAKTFPGTIYTYHDHSYSFPPCTRVTVTFVNHDTVRHQWMVHGLPTTIHEMGMFNIEVTGSGNDTGTFITPSEPETLMVHCGVPQHEQKGMKAQVKVGGGTGDLAGIPGVSGKVRDYQYPRESSLYLSMLMLVFGVLAGTAVVYAGPHRRLRRWLSEEHDIHLSLGRFGISVHSGTEKTDMREQIKQEVEGKRDEDAEEEDDAAAEDEPEDDPAEDTEDAAGTEGDDWLEEDEDTEVGNW